ncbi:MAG: hypothetical protein WC444_06185 [Candidatus Paceibacterota bacterium]
MNKTDKELEDEFNKAMLEDVDPVCMKQNEGVVLTQVEYSESVDTTTHATTDTLPGQGYGRHKNQQVQLSRARQRQKKQDTLPMIGGEYGMYACDNAVARVLWMAKGQDSIKPRWAVKALVTLRDNGVCQVCGDECDTHGEVVRKTPSVAGGEFNEFNCILVCPNCYAVWPKKSFDKTRSPMLNIYTQYMYVLKRRGFGRKGAVPLSAKGMEKYREVCHRLEDSQIRLEVELENMQRTVGKEIVKRRMTEEEYMEMISMKKKPIKDIEVSNLEPDMSVDEDGTVWRTVKE